MPAAHNHDAFQKAHKMYQEGSWKEALDTYNAIEPKGKGVWYNMGNCYYQLKEYPQAIVCWKRSLPGATSIECDDVACNIEHALEKCGAIKQSPSFVYTILTAISSSLPHGVWQFLFLAAWYTLFIFWFWGERYARRLLIMAVSFFMSMCIGLLLFVSYQNSERTCGIILSKHSDILSGPHENFDVLDTLEQGEEVVIQEKRPSWYKVKSLRSSGWIPANRVEVI